jgi:hypothetical protein
MGMRTLIILLILGSASSAAAQTPRDPPRRDPTLRELTYAQDAQRNADARAARNRDIALANQLSVNQATVQTDRVIANVAAATARPPVTPLALDPRAPPPMIDVSQLAQIPDAMLAASNARARAAADNRH